MRKPNLSRPHPSGLGGEQHIYKFQNNYGASVVKFPFSFGVEQDLWELAVIHFPDTEDLDDFELVAVSSIADDCVIGRLTDKQVDELLLEIEELPISKDKE